MHSHCLSTSLTDGPIIWKSHLMKNLISLKLILLQKNFSAHEIVSIFIKMSTFWCFLLVVTVLVMEYKANGNRNYLPLLGGVTHVATQYVCHELSQSQSSLLISQKKMIKIPFMTLHQGQEVVFFVKYFAFTTALNTNFKLGQISHEKLINFFRLRPYKNCH